VASKTKSTAAPQFASPENRFRLAQLRAAIKPSRLYWFSTLRSTNDHARFLRTRGRLFAPAIVLTSRQTAGRGRGNNTWWSNRGVLTVTFVTPTQENVPPQQIPLIAGLAVREAVANITGEPDFQLKWPNDLLYRGRKLAGLLCERVDSVDLIGLGLNVNVEPSEAPAELRNQIVSMQKISGRSFPKTEVLAGITRSLAQLFRRRIEQPFSTFVKEYGKHDALNGKTITIHVNGDQPPLRGKCHGIDVAGRLLLKDRSKTHAVVAGNVTIGSGH
jgi:BirA family transcriptional regulator, biotin operon repressor / biotin---[acetyl-CoA-carboxylase] ligase